MIKTTSYAQLGYRGKLWNRHKCTSIHTYIHIYLHHSKKITVLLAGLSGKHCFFLSYLSLYDTHVNNEFCEATTRCVSVNSDVLIMWMYLMVTHCITVSRESFMDDSGLHSHVSNLNSKLLAVNKNKRSIFSQCKIYNLAQRKTCWSKENKKPELWL